MLDVIISAITRIEEEMYTIHRWRKIAATPLYFISFIEKKFLISDTSLVPL